MSDLSELTHEQLAILTTLRQQGGTSSPQRIADEIRQDVHDTLVTIHNLPDGWVHLLWSDHEAAGDLSLTEHANAVLERAQTQ